MRAAIGYAMGEDAIGLARFRERYLSKMSEGPDARAFEVVTAPIGATGTEFRGDCPLDRGGRHARGVPARPARALSGDRHDARGSTGDPAGGDTTGNTAGPHCRGLITSTSGVDLTFATHLAANSERECQIQNSTSKLYLLLVL